MSDEFTRGPRPLWNVCGRSGEACAGTYLHQPTWTSVSDWGAHDRVSLGEGSVPLRKRGGSLTGPGAASPVTKKRQQKAQDTVARSTTRTRVSSHKVRCDTQYNTRAPRTHTHMCPQLRLVSAVTHSLPDLLPWVLAVGACHCESSVVI